MDGQQSKSEAVYCELRERIVEGAYAPGYRLVLGRLAEEFDVSVVPVREAIRRLEAEGFITFTRNVGAEVTPIDVDNYREAMCSLMYLEGVATALSAPNLTEADLAEAQALHETMTDLVENDFDPFEYSKLNGKFHMMLCRRCENTRLMALLRTEAERAMMLRRAEFRFTMQRSQVSVRQHGELLDMLREGADPCEIEQKIRNHKRDSLHFLGLADRQDERLDVREGSFA